MNFSVSNGLRLHRLHAQRGPHIVFPQSLVEDVRVKVTNPLHHFIGSICCGLKDYITNAYIRTD